MVSFICDACQETVKKNKVAAHYQRKCRNCWTLSCVDCGRTFQGDEYEAHTSCISEAEKYQGALYQAKVTPDGKADPQIRWTLLVRRLALSQDINMSPAVRSLLERMSDNSNVPRKEKKFLNFINSAYHVQANSSVAQQVWQALQIGWAQDKEEIDKQRLEQEKQAKKAKEAAARNENEMKKKQVENTPSENNSEAQATCLKTPSKGQEKVLRKEIKLVFKKRQGKAIKVGKLYKELKQSKAETLPNKRSLRQFLESKKKRYQLTSGKKKVLLL